MAKARRPRPAIAVLLASGFGAFGVVTGASESATQGPFGLVLGTALDGGLPQIGGVSSEDEAARRDPRRRRLVASLLIVDPASRERFLIDATPDIREQTDLAEQAAPRPKTGARPPLFDAIALTHAHVGHYAGLLHLGREAYSVNRQRILASGRMARFLEGNGPWDLLVKLNHIRIEKFTADQEVRLNKRLSLNPVAVPHRDEYSDTYGFIVRGQPGSLLWLPDIDKWENWERKIEDVIAGVDVAYIDGTFFDGDELPGRSMSEVPHPFITESLSRFAALPLNERRKGGVHPLESHQPRRNAGFESTACHRKGRNAESPAKVNGTGFRPNPPRVWPELVRGIMPSCRRAWTARPAW